MVILLMGDFKDLSRSLVQYGYRSTIDPEDDYDLIISDAVICHAIPMDNDTPIVIKLFRKLSDIQARNRFPNALFAYSNEDIIDSIESFSKEIIRELPNSYSAAKSSLVISYHNKGGTGATTVARSVAHGLADSGISTVLLDFDFRGPNIASCYKMGRKASNYLNQPISAELIQQNTMTTRTSNLAVLPLAVGNLDFSGLRGERLEGVCEILKQRFESIVIDTTICCHQLSYMQGLLKKADHLLVVVDQSKVVQDEIPHYSAALKSIGVSLNQSCLIVNRYNTKMSSIGSLEKSFYGSSRLNRKEGALTVCIGCGGEKEIINSKEWQPLIRRIAAGRISDRDGSLAKNDAV